MTTDSAAVAPPRVVWTVGHSNRTIEEFLKLLAGSSIELVADVRKTPSSKKFPHFNASALAEALAEAGVQYRHYPELGGRRGKRAPDSPNTGWRIEAFNAFADHLESPEGETAVADLSARAEVSRTAYMCSEAVPWQCHRRLLSDALVVRGLQVFDIMSPGKVVPHKMTPFLRVQEGRLTYPAEPLLPD
ncbi:MAG: DUF488 domain-containing protein [Isosphaeraceae bacterium]